VAGLLVRSFIGTELHSVVETVDIHGSNFAMHFSITRPSSPSDEIFVINGPAVEEHPDMTNIKSSIIFFISSLRNKF